MNRLLPIIALMMLLAQACIAASPAELANKAYSAERTASFTGILANTVFLPQGVQTSTVNVQRRGAKSRMEYTSGPLRGVVMIEDGQSVTRLNRPARCFCTTLTAERRPDLKLLLSNYKAVAAGSESVAGRQAHVLRLEPKHAGNPKVKLWVDAGTGVILRNERYLYSGKLIARSEYRSISYSSVPKSSAFAIPAGWKENATLPDMQPLSAQKLGAKVGFTLLKPSYVPAGYKLDGSFLQSSCGCMLGAAMKYTNGLNTISVFQHRCGMGPGRGMGRGRGLGMGQGRGMRAGCGQCVLRSDPQAEVAQRVVGNVMVVVMGNLSPELLRKMAESF